VEKVTKVVNPEGLEEGICCAMCTNPMRSDRGCNGECQYDEALYNRICEVVRKNTCNAIVIPDGMTRADFADVLNRVLVAIRKAAPPATEKPSTIMEWWETPLKIEDTVNNEPVRSQYERQCLTGVWRKVD
jgi:hypothetical protein